jgi:D-cysteine desulfhydrase
MPYLLGPGGSSSLAALGYVNAASDLADQIKVVEIPEPHSIVIPLGTGALSPVSSLALRLAGLDTRLVAVSITRRPPAWRPPSCASPGP